VPPEIKNKKKLEGNWLLVGIREKVGTKTYRRERLCAI
jgi:hypothetical protein